MKELALRTPTKDAKKIEKLEFNLVETAPLEELPIPVDSATGAEVDVELEELRKQFVGDVDVTEGPHYCLSSSRRASDDTPLRSRAPAHGDQASFCIVPYPIP